MRTWAERFLRGLALVVVAAGCRAPEADDRGVRGDDLAIARSASPSAPPSALTPPGPGASDAAASGEKIPTGMVVIPEGVFLQGGVGEETSPQHEGIVARFLFDAAETTMAEYAACVAAGRCLAPKTDNPFCNARFADRAEHPVNCIDFVDASAYCAFVGKRLPTEREWEYAARGGREQRKYAWGDDEPSPARACFMHPGGSCPVRSYAAGAFGLYDMTGNVWEWTSSHFAPYPVVATAGATRVYRGGSWSRRFAKWMTNDLRNRYAEHEQSASLGVRCARSIEPRVCPPDTEARGDRCERVRGEPLCPAGHAWAAGACRPGGVVPAFVEAPRGLRPADDVSVEGRRSSASSARPPDGPPDAPTDKVAPIVTRSPAFDADCERHYPGRPQGYQVTGGRFHDREPVVVARGCKKRDTSVSWTSMCCP